MDTPKTFWQLAEEWEGTTYLDGPECAKQLKELCREHYSMVNHVPAGEVVNKRILGVTGE